MPTVTNARPTRQARAREEEAAILRAPTPTRTFLDIDLVEARGNVENWLLQLQSSMRLTVKHFTQAALKKVFKNTF